MIVILTQHTPTYVCVYHVAAIPPSVAANKETMKGLLPLYKADLRAVDATVATYEAAGE